MKTKLLFIYLLAFLFSSCQDELNLVMSSKLNVKVVDANGVPIPNVKIKLFDRSALTTTSVSSYESLYYINVGLTDAKGNIDFGDVAAGTYFISADSVRVNGLCYQPIMQFQMISAIDKTITIKPEDYITTFNFTISKIDASSTTGLFTIAGFKDLNILMIPSSLYKANYTLDKLITLAEVKSKTDDAGQVALRVPSYRSYVPVVFNENKTVYSLLMNSEMNFINGDKDATTNYSLNLDPTTLKRVNYGVLKLLIKKVTPDPTSTSPNQLPFTGLNVAAIPNNYYDSNIPWSILIKSAAFTGKTDAAGNISFLLNTNENYTLVAYSNDNTNGSIITTSAYVSSEETRQMSYTLLESTLSPAYYSTLYLTINKTSSVYYTSSPQDLTPYSNLNVALVTYSANNATSSIDELLSKTIASGKTNESGQMSFVLGLPSTYTYYQIVAYNADKTAKFVSSMFNMYPGNSSSLSYSLNTTTLAAVN